MTNGYRPSVARTYSPEDARQHFYHFYEDKCVLIFMAEGPKGIVEATGVGIEEAVEKFKDGVCKQVDSQLIANWFNQLNWTQQTIDDEVQGMIDNDKHDGLLLKFLPIGKPFQKFITMLSNEFVMNFHGQKI
ncbi:hypothetical protein [Enterococcus rivorum]|uniref:hypothetical protein n=1 Tax=Enterococcus rivorum TaxID=762845 RepID=UPI0036372E95